MKLRSICSIGLLPFLAACVFSQSGTLQLSGVSKIVLNSCNFSSDCVAPATCVSGYCLVRAACGKDTDCDPGQTCNSDSLCVYTETLLGLGEACNAHSDCQRGLECDAKKCAYSTCTADNCPCAAAGNCPAGTCVPETTAATCTRLGYDCGSAMVTDNCNNLRAITCGGGTTCGSGKTCGATNKCTCNDSDAQMCARAGKACGGPFTLTDQCGEARQVTCGAAGLCPSGQACVADTCQCDETDAQLCSRLGYDCGQDISTLDLCGSPRTVTCGSLGGTCAFGQTCGSSQANVCACNETSGQICVRLGWNCGNANTLDVCGYPRTVSCGALGGACPPNQACGFKTANVCDYNTLPPASLSATSTATNDQQTGQITVSWATGVGADSYQVLRSTNMSTGFTVVGTPTTSPFVDTGLPNSAVRYYIVQSCNSGVCGSAGQTGPVLGNTKTASGTMTYASRNTKNGSITLNWTAVVGEAGAMTYTPYYRTSPAGAYTALPNVAALSATNTLSTGTLYYFSYRAVNANTGPGDYAVDRVGYSSDIAIVYNDGDGTDTAQATTLKSWLGTNYSAVYSANIFGTMPSWSVTLVPQSVVPGTFSNNDIFYGDPLITTNGNTLSGNDEQVHLVTAHGHGVLATGSYATAMYLLDRTYANWAAWGYGGQSPGGIGWLPSALNSAPDIWWNVINSATGVWSSPYSCNVMNTTDGQVNQMDYTAPGHAVERYRGGTNGPTGGYDFQVDPVSTSYAPVATQGRFAQYGFTILQDRPFTGQIFLINVIYFLNVNF